MQCDHSFKCYWAVLSCGAVCFVIQCGSNFFSLWIKPCSVTILSNATEQYFHVVLFVLSYSVVLTFLVCGSNHAVWPFFRMLLSSTFMWGCLFCDTMLFVFLSQAVYQAMRCDHPLKSYWTELLFSILFASYICKCTFFSSTSLVLVSQIKCALLSFAYSRE